MSDLIEATEAWEIIEQLQAEKEALQDVVNRIGKFAGGDDPLTFTECVRLCEELAT